VQAGISQGRTGRRETLFQVGQQQALLQLLELLLVEFFLHLRRELASGIKVLLGGFSLAL